MMEAALLETQFSVEAMDEFFDALTSIAEDKKVTEFNVTLLGDFVKTEYEKLPAAILNLKAYLDSVLLSGAKKFIAEPTSQLKDHLFKFMQASGGAAEGAHWADGLEQGENILDCNKRTLQTIDPAQLANFDNETVRLCDLIRLVKAKFSVRLGKEWAADSTQAELELAEKHLVRVRTTKLEYKCGRALVKSAGKCRTMLTRYTTEFTQEYPAVVALYYMALYGLWH